MSSVGDMLRLARQRRGFTQKDAAARLDVVQPVLSRMENGVSEADEAFLMKACAVYEVPRAFFDLRDPVYGPPVSVHPMLRGKADVTAREVDIITAELNIRVIHMRRFLEGVELAPTADIPVLDIEQYGSPARIAGVVRAHWGLPRGPIKNLTQTAERAGIVIAWSKFGGAAVSGVTFRVPGHPPLVLLNESHPADRMRFTLAHELGHLVMHRFPTADMESEANEFASALLMPEDEIRTAFMGRKVTLELLAAMKPEWRVAMQALLVRASTLGLILPNQSRYLWQRISARGWRLREPPELDFAPETPRVLPRIVASHLNELHYTPTDLANLLRIRQGEFAEMYGAASAPDPQKPRLRVVS